MAFCGVALTAPKNTAFCEAVVLKFVPFIVMVVPGDADVGVNEVIVGGPALLVAKEAVRGFAVR